MIDIPRKMLMGEWYTHGKDMAYKFFLKEKNVTLIVAWMIEEEGKEIQLIPITMKDYYYQ